MPKKVIQKSREETIAENFYPQDSSAKITTEKESKSPLSDIEAPKFTTEKIVKYKESETIEQIKKPMREKKIPQIQTKLPQNKKSFLYKPKFIPKKKTKY